MNSTSRTLMVAAAAFGTQMATGEAASQVPDTNEGQQVVLVTGSTDGLGREVALRLGAMAAHVIVHGRNAERSAEVVAEIEAGPGTASFIPADFASLEEVRALATRVLEEHDRLDLLVNNAGIGSLSPERQLSRDGHELRFQVNYLSSFLLTRMLLPRLMDSSPSRIVNVASAAQTPLEFNDVTMERGYTGSRAYGQSKLAQILFTFDLAEELDGMDVIVNALHPATYMDTQMVRASGRTPLSTVDEGADAVLNLITTPGLQSGQYFNQTRPAEANDQAYDWDARTQLRALSAALTGVD